ncbi:arsenic transporter [Bacillus sp. FJAT-42376]|uniref:ArsB/NhaD family transporter n=1 Tax=Bacillus sp. FJAT-42376 TaxID=2014076 RepID=UPI000F4F2944|nr:ArsB/NhaD family transporter [Bacillus sp. FJAT-42376]AZB43348.1 arsenic transporter [Bacillus sp. FJAT-42376]
MIFSPGFAAATIIFLFTMILVITRPMKLNEAIYSSAGALIVVLLGIVSLSDISQIYFKIEDASITIISNFILALILDKIGFFQLVAEYLIKRSRNSGIRLFWLTAGLSYLMTLLFNNDGCILILTPLLIKLLNATSFKKHEKIPILLTSALIATASSAPIGVSNVVNLVALKIIGMSLHEHVWMMFLPATMGVVFLTFLLYVLFRKKIPKQFHSGSVTFDSSRFHHPLKPVPQAKINSRHVVLICCFILGMRLVLISSSLLGLSLSFLSIAGVLLLYMLTRKNYQISMRKTLAKAPWHVFIFAFSMYILIFSLNNVGITAELTKYLTDIVEQMPLVESSMTIALVTSVLSNLINNHPALMLMMLALSDAHLSPVILKASYMAIIIGSDIGSLVTPIGTLATMLWMFILKENGIKFKWKSYLKITILVIPLTTAATVFFLLGWIYLNMIM